AARRLASKRAADDEKEFLVLALHGIEELVSIIGTHLPIRENCGDRAGAGGWPQLFRQQRDHRVGIRSVLHHQELAAVVPRWRLNEAGRPVGRKRCGIAARVLPCRPISTGHEITSSTCSPALTLPLCACARSARRTSCRLTRTSPCGGRSSSRRSRSRS